MPRYVYKCKDCEASFMTVHGIMEDQDHCEVCFNFGSVFRIPQMPTVRVTKEKSGNLVKEFIEDSRKELNEEKKKLTSEEYDR